MKLSWAACALIVTSTARSWADTDACIEQYDAAVAARQKGQLIESRGGYATCATAACPPEIKSECERGAQALAKEIPSVVFAVRAESGTDVTSGRLSIDGKENQRALEGLPVEVDPGKHQVVLVLADGRRVESTVIARAGEQNRLIQLVVPAKPRSKPKPEKPREPPPRSVLGPILLGTGAVALTSFGVFAALGRSKQSDLEECKPACAPDDIDDMQRLYLIADISLAVSVLALGSGTYLVLQPRSGESATLAVGGRF